MPQIYPNFGGNRYFGFREFPLNHSNNFHFLPFKHPNTVPFHLFSLKQTDGKVVFGPIQTSLTDLFFAPIPSLQTIPFTLSRSLFLSLSLSHTHSHSTWKSGYVFLSEFFYSQRFFFSFFFFSFPLMLVFSNRKNLCLWISVENIFTIATKLHYILRFSLLCALVISVHFLMFLYYLIHDCILGLSKLNLQLPYDVWEIAQGL